MIGQANMHGCHSNRDSEYPYLRDEGGMRHVNILQSTCNTDAYGFLALDSKLADWNLCGL